LHAFRILEMDIPIAPRCDHGRVYQGGAFCQETLEGGIEIGDLQGEADRPTNSRSDFDLVYSCGLLLVE
jgi:hypothetical protein